MKSATLAPNQLTKISPPTTPPITSTCNSIGNLTTPVSNNASWEPKTQYINISMYFKKLTPKEPAKPPSKIAL